MTLGCASEALIISCRTASLNGPRRRRRAGTLACQRVHLLDLVPSHVRRAVRSSNLDRVIEQVALAELVRGFVEIRRMGDRAEDEGSR